MEHPLHIYNTLSRKKEQFIPLHESLVGLYVCGPTVYGDAHLGHARPAITFDVLVRYLRHLGYKVRYVRNITDVGHLEHDADEGEDKIAKKARLEQLEPMEVVQYYLTRYHRTMDKLGVLPPSIEPMASGHIIEQIDLVQRILDAGYAYESKGSVYFDVAKYNADHHYGRLSGRNIEDMLSNTRSLDGQDEKRQPLDFALWKAAQPQHIMRWPSPWSEGFPGWHCECTAMGKKYLGEVFDIHGGGMDLVFPHHECEIAQAVASQGKDMVRYWMHNNMITINGQKMGKSLGNFITLDQFFTGDHPALEQAYSPMTVRFFILGAHYRGTVDFSNSALQAAEKALARLWEAEALLDGLKPSDESSVEISDLAKQCEEAMNDDLNSPKVIAALFDASRVINSVHNGQATITAEQLDSLRTTYRTYLFDILGLDNRLHAAEDSKAEAYAKAVDLLLDIRAEAKMRKDWPTSDKIRDTLTQIGFTIKDTKEGTEWTL
ncbi:cysteinyl-tRNA synthetase [Porphyromonas crevioricanis JCM 15906]|uniref:Cysteine--tRNA ligase n=2 Tax=Porphyromonas crevioricanis TaxID=393921 RepID=A0AB34PGC4_9PORP|nr:cysteine--tRNA ligase [Porphyromonas crevioricanis]KGN94944.1 cysteinyl-tRNA synthetase [Porphyromonas crevioricanis]GAD05848.1 cysteinyl-tRNA synthetase [Porphyromonas crevioricanis JCM 15906]SJZ82309.1 cysteinyl-tRNA synthetase [Porphyromonas crevioricanis]